MAESAFHSTAHASTLHHQRIIKPSVEAVLIRSMETDVFVVRSSDDNRYHAVSQLVSNFSHLQLLSNCISFSSGFMVIIRETVMTSEISCVDAGNFHSIRCLPDSPKPDSPKLAFGLAFRRIGTEPSIHIISFDLSNKRFYALHCVAPQ